MVQDLAHQVEWGLNSFLWGAQKKINTKDPTAARHVSLLEEGREMLHQKNQPLSALVKDVTSFFSWGCRDTWHFPCREVYFSFGKGWKTIWAAYYFRHILHSYSPSEKEAAFSHFCNTPLFPRTKPRLIKHMGLDPWLIQTQASIKLCWFTPGDLHLHHKFLIFL